MNSTEHPAIIKLFCIFSFCCLYAILAGSLFLYPASFSTYLIAIKKHNILKIKQKVFLLHCRRRCCFSSVEKGFRPFHNTILHWTLSLLVLCTFVEDKVHAVVYTRVTQLAQTTPYAKFLFIFSARTNEDENKGRKNFFCLATSITNVFRMKRMEETASIIFKSFIVSRTWRLAERHSQNMPAQKAYYFLPIAYFG